MATCCYSSSDTDLQQAAQLLQAGKLVAFPTETVYGLGALALQPACLKRLYAAKRRPSNNPVIVHVHTAAQAQALCSNSPMQQQRFERLAALFWPGPLTLVCVKSPCVPIEATAGSAKVAVRISSHAIAQRLLQLVGQPLAAPSANASSRVSPTCAQHVLTTLAERIDAVIDAGPCAVGVESTVVDITTPTATLLRPGAIGQQQLSHALQQPVLQRQPPPAHQPQTADSPGLLGKHYAPNIAHITLANVQQMQQAWHNPNSAMLLQQSSAHTLQQQLGEPSAHIRLLHNYLPQRAQQLYACLHELEQLAPSRLLIEQELVQTNEQGLAAAIADRLRRACRQP
ncbi:MAG: L-threonylcarbamoyladenylate synthase [Myxococcota bacterium]